MKDTCLEYAHISVKQYTVSFSLKHLIFEKTGQL